MSSPKASGYQRQKLVSNDVNDNDNNNNNKHEKSDSEALLDLESVFVDVDIDGEGLLDQASFLTALKILGVQLPSNELEIIFSLLDENESGMIEYKRLQNFMKMGKIPSTLLNKVKNNNDMGKKRKSVLIGGNFDVAKNKKKKLKNRALLPIVNEKKLNEKNEKNEKNVDENKMEENEEENEENEEDEYDYDSSNDSNSEEMNPERLKMIQRAVIVIKKAAIKNISRKEVEKFLTDKGMNLKDVKISYNRAQKQALSNEERIRYFQNLCKEKSKELENQERINKYLKSEITVHTRETQILRDLLKLSAHILTEKHQKKYQENVPKGCADEIKEKIIQTTSDLSKAKQNNDQRASKVHARDLETLTNVSKCITDKLHFHANLYFHVLDDVIRDGMPQTSNFLQKFDDPM